MSHTVYFNIDSARALVFAVLTAAALSVQAQTTGESEAASQAEAADTQQVSSEETAKPVKATSAQASTTKPKSKPAKIKAQSARNADNYEASEEISEDLSVSYPVDI